jgi:hypothetical protein
MAASVLYILFAGLFGWHGRTLVAALGLVLIECVVFAGNGFKCPLTTLAQRHGAVKGYVFDTFIPERWTRYTVPVFTTILVAGLLLLAFRFGS